jgi:hypothetical protein
MIKQSRFFSSLITGMNIILGLSFDFNGTATLEGRFLHTGFHWRVRSFRVVSNWVMETLLIICIFRVASTSSEVS